jgi:uncharacterized protein YecE (DUF72 family)
MPGQVRIGISGWRYAPWRGPFYPKGLKQDDELAFAARHFDSIEINGSFYSLQSPELYSAWRDATPQDFVFAVKGSRFITHMKRLRDFEQPLGRVRRPGFGTRTLRPLRHAVEVRHATFRTPEFVALLRRHGLALVVADTAGRWPYFEDQTADFAYVRLHGDEKLYVSGYSPSALAHWAKKIAAFRRGVPGDAPVLACSEPAPPGARDVYVYFDNDVKVHAPFDAASLMQKLGQAHTPRLRRAKSAGIPEPEARTTWPPIRRARVAR